MKIQVDETGLKGRKVNPYDSAVNEIEYDQFNDENEWLPLTEKATPNSIVDAELVWQICMAYDEEMNPKESGWQTCTHLDALEDERNGWNTRQAYKVSEVKEDEPKIKNMKTGIELIAIERQEQIEKHGYDKKHDEIYNDENSHSVGSDLRYAAIHALWPQGQFYPRKWNDWFKDKISAKTYKERLIIAGALIAAEIDRMQNINP